MDNFQKAAVLFSELKRELEIRNEDDRQYLDVLKVGLDKLDAKECVYLKESKQRDKKI